MSFIITERWSFLISFLWSTLPLFLQNSTLFVEKKLRYPGHFDPAGIESDIFLMGSFFILEKREQSTITCQSPDPFPIYLPSFFPLLF